VSAAPCILLAGGGTGGHVFPMIAVADALRTLVPDIELVFVGTARGIETRVVPERGYRLELVDIIPMRGAGVWGVVRCAWRAASSIPRARRLIEEYQPRAVFSLGGYAAGSVSLAARLNGIPLTLMEPNSVIGLANRLVAQFVDRAYIAFDSAERHFDGAVVRRTGVAIRRGFGPRAYRYDGRILRVLVLGGSQGAKALNETVPEALAKTQVTVRVVHQAGRGFDASVRERYAALGAGSHVSVTPFIDDVPGALGEADLVIGRAGAGAVSEICAVGRPSILVPYPFAAGDHQRLNAEALERAGAALCVDSKAATAQYIAGLVDELCRSEGRLDAMAVAARHWGRPDAALVVARDLLELAGISGRRPVSEPVSEPPARDDRASEAH